METTKTSQNKCHRALYLFIILQLLLSFYSSPYLTVEQHTERHARITTKEQNNVAQEYQPSAMESLALSHGYKLGYRSRKAKNADACNLWANSTPPIKFGATANSTLSAFQLYREELKEYTRRLSEYQPSIKDLREHFPEHDEESTPSICDKLEVHPDGLQGIFRNSHGLSQLPGGVGYMEPLLPPFRHPEICFQFHQYLMNLNYLVHDFAALCRNKLKRRSRTVLIDMGASLSFHAARNRDSYPPAVYLLAMYQKFGFRFDHIYAYELTKQDPETVYQMIPNDFRAAYHWYNVGVNASLQSDKNPLKMLLESFNEDDFVVVKLDIDTSRVEVPMVQLLLQEEKLQKLVDCFYFEHHVFMKQLSPYWTNSMQGSMLDSLRLFSTLREKGIAAHYWP